MFYNLFGLLLLFASLFVSISADTFKECEGKEETYAEIQEDCSFYIFCHGEESFSDSCPEESPYFSVEEQTCDADKSVCKDRPILDETFDSTTVKEEISTDAASNAAINTTTSSSSSSATTTISSITSAQSTTSFSTSFQTVPTPFSPTLVPTSCPAIDNPNKVIFLPHTKSCSDYFLCFRGVRLPMHCSNSLHFNVRQQKCDYPENAKCHMMDVATPREQCLSHTFDFYPHPRNCNYYYQCTLGYLRVMQCPLNMGWHYEKRACVMRSKAKCYNTFARSLLN